MLHLTVFFSLSIFIISFSLSHIHFYIYTYTHFEAHISRFSSSLSLQFFYHSRFTLFVTVRLYAYTKHKARKKRDTDERTSNRSSLPSSPLGNPQSGVHDLVIQTLTSLRLSSQATSTLGSKDPSDFNFVPCRNYWRKNSLENQTWTIFFVAWFTISLVTKRKFFSCI